MVSAVSNQIEIDGLKLPSAPQTLIQLIEVCHRDDVDFDELHRIIARDAALVSRILEVAHSAAYAQWSEVGDLRRLLVVLGIDTVRSLALAAAVQQFFSAFSSLSGDALGRLWMDALICARLSRRLAELTRYPHADLAWLAGLLHRSGQLVLLDNAPDDYPQLMSQAVDMHHLLRLERDRYGFDNCEIGARLIERWGEADLADALRFQFHPVSSMRDSHPLVKLLNRAAQWTLLHSEPQRAVLEDGLFDLQQDLLLDLLAGAVSAAQEDARNFSVDTDPVSHYPVESLDNEETRLRLAEQIQCLSLIEAGESGLTVPHEPESLLRQLQHNLRALGLPLSLAFLPDDSRSKLHGIDPSTRDFEILLQPGRSQVADCALGIPAGSRQQEAVIDRQLCERLGRPAFFCLPLMSEQQLQAVLLIGHDEREWPRLEARRGVIEQLGQRVARMLLQQRLQHQEQQQLLQQQRLEIEQHSRALAHEIKNPLTTIRNYLELLSRQIQDVESRPHIETIKSEIDRVGKLLRQLHHPGDPLEAEQSGAVDINRLIEDLVALYRPELQALHEIHCELELANGLTPQPIDRNRLKQVLTNLLKNAAEALPPGGQVLIQTRAPVIADGQTCFEISVADDGPGVGDAVLPRLFSPLTSTKGGDHSGLGLSIVHRLVQEMGGSIRYGRSARLGGAEFTLLLPMTASGSASSPQQDG